MRAPILMDACDDEDMNELNRGKRGTIRRISKDTNDERWRNDDEDASYDEGDTNGGQMDQRRDEKSDRRL